MRKISTYSIQLMLLLGSCSPFSVATKQPVTLSAQIITHTPVVISTPLPIATPTIAPAVIPSKDGSVRFDGLDMVDETSGWSWGNSGNNNSLLLHTSDGGQTWMDATPKGESMPVIPPHSSYFLDAQTAWVIQADESLAQTSDGGKTWEVINQNLKAELTWPHRDWYRLHFADANHGWLVAGYSAAGAHEFYYETRDGGASWNPLDFETWPEDLYDVRDYKNELAFWTVIDAIYYDSTKFIIAPGEQEGTPKVFLSTDWGSSWKTIQLLPSEYHEQSFNPFDRKILQPIFFDSQNGILTVSIWDRTANTVQLFVYGTSDGGLTWPLTGGPIMIEQGDSEISFLSVQDAVYFCGVRFCSTNDSGNTWVAHNLGTDIPPKDDHTSLQLDFVNPATGWLLIRMNDAQGIWLNSRLLRTTDGGLTWTELSPRINP